MSRKSPQVDAARLAIMLTELRLPTIKAMWPKFTEQADQVRKLQSDLTFA